MDKVHSLKYNFIMNFILTASRFVFPLITFPYVSRVLQVEGNGKIAFVSSVANYFLMVASLGIPTYGVRACAQVRDDKIKLSKRVQEIMIINLIMTVLTVVAYIISIFTVSRFYQEKTLFIINGVGICLNMFGMEWLYKALEQYDYITVRSLAFKVISIVLMFLMVHKEVDYLLYGGITVFSTVGSNVLNFIRSRRYIDYKYQGNYNLRQHIKPIFVLFAQSLVVSIYTNLDTVMLGFMKDDREVGLYNAATKLKSILVSLVTSLGNVLLPRMSYYVNKKLKDEFYNIAEKAINFTLLLSLAVTLYFVFYSKDCIFLLAGEQYVDAVSAMQIITVSVIPIGLTGVLGIQILTSLEKEKYVLYSVIAGAVVDFVLNYIFIQKYGASGAAFATMIAEFIVLAVQLYYTKDILEKMKGKFRGFIYLISGAFASGMVYLASFIIPLAIDYIFVKLCVTAIVFFGSYVVCLLFFREPLIVQYLGKLKKR